LLRHSVSTLWCFRSCKREPSNQFSRIHSLLLGVQFDKVYVLKRKSSFVKTPVNIDWRRVCLNSKTSVVIWAFIDSSAKRSVVKPPPRKYFNNYIKSIFAEMDLFETWVERKSLNQLIFNQSYHREGDTNIAYLSERSRLFVSPNEGLYII